MSTSPVAQADRLQAHYVTEAYGVTRVVRAVDDISIHIGRGEIYGIAGESGCGKSTLLKVLLGMHEPPLRVIGGSVTYSFEDQSYNVLALSERDRRDLRWRRVSYVPQGSMHVLNPLLRIQDTFHDFIGAHQKVTRRSSKAMTSDYLRDLGLPVRVLAAYPHQLSGGMRQRVTIALATILRPALIFADEPTTALDVIVQRGVIELLKEVRTQRGSTMVVVTHDMGVHANLSDRIAVLYAGELVEEADTLSIFQQPRHPYTQHLIQSLPRLDDKTERLSLSGRPPSLDDVPSGCRFHPRCPYAMPVCREVRPPMVAVRDAAGSQHRVACHLIAEGTSAGGSRADA